MTKSNIKVIIITVIIITLIYIMNMEDTKIMKLNEVVFNHIQKCKTLYTKLINKVAKDYELTFIECEILLFLHINPIFNRAKDISLNRMIAKSNVSTAVENLKNKEYLRVEKDESNRRISRLFLRDNAQEIIEKLEVARSKFKSILEADFTQEEYDIMVNLMYRANDNINKALVELENSK